MNDPLAIDARGWNPRHYTDMTWESGPKARPFDVQWARDTIAQCRTAGVPVFVKQLGANPFEIVGREMRAGIGFASCTLTLKHRAGGDMAEWPADLRVRETPTTTQED